MEPAPRERVAIVGSGLAGLLSAYLLAKDARQRYTVKVFESGQSLSLDAASFAVPKPAGHGSDRVDLPMRAFAGGYYRNLKALYDCIGVRYRRQPFLFEFAQHHSYFTHASNLHQLPPRPAHVGRLQHVAQLLYLAVAPRGRGLMC